MIEKTLDKLAYEIVCDWYKAVEFNPVYQNIDYSQILRFYLWDKVGRALRIKHHIDFEEKEVYLKEYRLNNYYHTPLQSNGKYKKPLFFKRKVLFIPFQSHTTEIVVKALKKKSGLDIISKEQTSFISKRSVIKSPEVSESNTEWSSQLFKAVESALVKYEVELISEDLELLKEQVYGSVAITQLALQELKLYNPEGLYVHSDNHPPYINYVLAAKSMDIPTITYQHGLDCEHYYLEDCYADHVAVWSNHRKEKYVNSSRFQPKNLKIIGNVFITDEHFKLKSNTESTILFAARPHKPAKCYSPSRNYLEGKHILEAILEFMKSDEKLKLIIQPHPMDYMEGYHEAISNHKMESRVSISSSRVHDILPNVNIVVTEDTTVGAEAMHYGLPCVHAHFADSEPVLPYVQYHAALPARSKTELTESLERVFNLSQDEKLDMSEGQHGFINDVIPLGEVNNLVSFISENIK